MANTKSSLVQIAQATLDEDNQAVKVNIVASSGGAGGATEATALDILAEVESIDAKTPALDGGNVPVDVKASVLPTGAATETTSAAIEIAVESIDSKTPALVSGRVPVDVQASVLPTGAATEATLLDIDMVASETAVNTLSSAASLTSIDGKTPALGQALEAASVPVVLPAAQVATLTPQTDALTDAELRASAVPVSAASLPLPTGAATEAKQDTGNASLATLVTQTDGIEASLSSIDGKITTVNTGAVVVSSSVLPTGAATETTLAGIRTRQDVVDHGATTTAQRVAAQLGVGGVAVSASNPIPMASSGGASVQLASSTVHPYYQDFSTSSLTTTYTQVVASTGVTINSFSAVNNSATPIYISTGAAASEVVRYILMPGEVTGRQLLQIAAGTRIAIRTLTGTESSGKFSLNVFTV